MRRIVMKVVGERVRNPPGEEHPATMTSVRAHAKGRCGRKEYAQRILSAGPYLLVVRERFHFWRSAKRVALNALPFLFKQNLSAVG
jgi:hypothetical protein